MHHRLRNLLFACLIVFVGIPSSAKKAFVLIELKSQPGLMTEIIQNSINSCAEKGGGTVRFMGGTYLSGGIELKSKVSLLFEKGTILRGSDRYADYRNDALIFGRDLSEITITGEGIIDGVDCINKQGEEGFRGPHGIRLINCKNIIMEGITIRNSGNWAVNCRYCSSGTLTKVSIRGGHDGLHTRFCDHFTVKNCDFRTGDDCFAGNDNRHFKIIGCSVNSSCNGFRMGCRKLLVKNCRIWGPGESEHKISKRSNMLAAFVHFSPEDEHPKLKSSKWRIKNVTIENADFAYVYNHKNGLWQTGKPAGDIFFNHLNATGVLNAVIISDQPESEFSVTIRNSGFAFRAGAAQPPTAFEGVELDHPAFFQATSFKSIRLNRVYFQKKSDALLFKASGGKWISLKKVTFNGASQGNVMEMNNIAKVIRSRWAVN